MDFNTAYMNLIKHLKIKNYSPHTIEHYKILLSPFSRFMEYKKIRDIRQINRENIDQYLEMYTNKSVAVSTRRERIEKLKCLYAYLMKEGVLLINPCEDLKAPKRIYLPRSLLSLSEMEKLLNQPNLSLMTGIRDRSILELLYSTGIRLGECENLTIHDVDIKEKTVNVRKGKGDKDRVIPMGTISVKWIKEYIQFVRPRICSRDTKKKSLFLRRTGNSIKGELHRIVTRYIKQAKIKKRGITCHSIRHTFATELIRNGADIVSVQKLLGHKNINTTLIYTRVIPVDIKKTHLKTHPRG